MKNGVLEHFAKFTGKHVWFAKISKTPFYRTPLDDCFQLFRAMLLKWGTANNVSSGSDLKDFPFKNSLASLKYIHVSK